MSLVTKNTKDTRRKKATKPVDTETLPPIHEDRGILKYNDTEFGPPPIYIYDYYYSINNNNNNNNNPCNDIGGVEYKEYFFNWIEILGKPKYLKIIYFLVRHDFIHVGGVVKIFNEYQSVSSKQLRLLSKYGIIETIDKEKYKTDLYKHRQVFRLHEYQFNQIELYRLTELGKWFFGDLDYSLSLNPLIIDRVNNWYTQLHKTVKQVEQEGDPLERAYQKFKLMMDKNPDVLDNLYGWCENICRQIPGSNPQKLFNDFKTRYREEK